MTDYQPVIIYGVRGQGMSSYTLKIAHSVKLEWSCRKQRIKETQQC